MEFLVQLDHEAAFSESFHFLAAPFKPTSHGGMRRTGALIERHPLGGARLRLIKFKSMLESSRAFCSFLPVCLLACLKGCYVESAETN